MWGCGRPLGAALRGGAIALLLSAVLVGCGDGESGNPTGLTPGDATASSAGGHEGSESPSAAQESRNRKYVAMTAEGELHAMLAFKVYPAGGQVVGKYTLIHFDGSGREIRTKTDFNGRGTGTGTMFEFEGLTDYGNVKGALSEDRTRLKLDRTFGVEKTQWTIVSSEDVFESAVKKYAKRFESCSKKKEYNPCEDVTRAGWMSPP
ncbi:hypothetical protein SAMN05421870_104447 [Streptomyces qinglanensis]|uniref:Lipoprotein n=1 Tax=Streptomyces qinglanensis TaxID=943816 RepID=A0A1H9SCW4_9ACTN|nr:hypothetical protein SAMN05421870_104447 [Streptomyces qinglanensis]